MQGAWYAAASDCVVIGSAGTGEAAVIRHEGDHWTLGYGGYECHLRDTRGLRLMQYLLLRPGKEIRALQLELDTVAPDAEALRIGPMAAERARINVSRSLRTALERLRPAHRDLYLHLRATIKIGASCKYAPDTSVPIRWTA